MKHFRTRGTVLLISIFLLSSCGGSTSSTPTALTPEGTALSPNPLTNLNSATPNPGQVGNTTTGSKSYYAFTVPTTGTYTITLYGLSADADLWVFNDLPFDFITGPVCKSQNGGTSNEQCVVTATIGATMNIEVDGQYSLSGATYSIGVNYPLGAQQCGTTAGSTCFSFTPPDDSTELLEFVQTQTGSGTPSQWSIDTATATISGSHSIKSSGLLDSQTSCVSYTSTTATSYISFNAMTDSILYYDQLLFYIDNVLQLPVWSGPSATWQKVIFNTAAGTHTYKWCHTHTSSAPSGDVWVDDIYIQ